MAICNTENILRLIALEWSLDVTGENNVYVAMLEKGVDELFGYGTTPAEAISNLDGMVAATFPKPQSVTMTVSGGTGSNHYTYRVASPLRIYDATGSDLFERIAAIEKAVESMQRTIEMLKKTVPLSLEALQAKGMIITGEHISAAKTNVGYVQTTATTNTDGFNDL